MGFNDWIYVTPAPMAFDGREEEVDLLAKNRMATEVQTRLHGRIDPGVDLESAMRAQRVRVVAKEGQIIIDEEDMAGVLGGGRPTAKQESEGAGGIMSLFKMSSGIPASRVMPDGSRDLVFRSVDADKLFQRIAHQEQDDMVQGTVTESLRMTMVDAFEDASKEVQRRYPEDK